MKRKWRVGVKEKRLRIPMSTPWLHTWTPRFLRRWYMRKSHDWWGHPSNHHWKMFTFGCSCRLQAGERCLWAGGYTSEAIEVSQ